MEDALKKHFTKRELQRLERQWRKLDPARVQERAKRKAESNKRDLAEARALIEQIPGAKIGYIGNVERWGDDRAWTIWVGDKKVGSYVSTENRGQLLATAKLLFLGFECGRSAD